MQYHIKFPLHACNAIPSDHFYSPKKRDLDEEGAIFYALYGFGTLVAMTISKTIKDKVVLNINHKTSAP